MFEDLEKAAPDCYAVREYAAWHSLTYRTASCVRDTLAATCPNGELPREVRYFFDDFACTAPIGKVFVMQSGTKPVQIPRYDTLNSEEYREYLKANKSRQRTSCLR